MTCCKAVVGTSEKNNSTTTDVASKTTKKGKPSTRSTTGANTITQVIDPNSPVRKYGVSRIYR